MEYPKNLPERMFLVFEEITATNKKLQDLGAEAESVLEEAKQNGNFRNLEKYEAIAKNAAIGVLTDSCKSNKRCRWWNRGYCREGTARCPYYHPTEDCEQHLQDGHCFIQGCTLRHRRRCKYWATAEGCFRKEDCQYLHVDNPNNVTAGKENAKVVNMSQDKPLENHENKMDNTQEDLVAVNGYNPAYEEPEKESDEQDCMYYKCGICGFECKTEKIRLMLMNTKHKEYSECSICYTMVSSKETIDHHINSMHKGD